MPRLCLHLRRNLQRQAFHRVVNKYFGAARIASPVAIR